MPETAVDSHRAVLGSDWCCSLGLCSFVFVGFFVGAQTGPGSLRVAEQGRAQPAPQELRRERRRERRGWPAFEGSSEQGVVSTARACGQRPEGQQSRPPAGGRLPGGGHNVQGSATSLVA